MQPEKNRSTHETTELALALRALRKVGGHIGGNMRPIYWSGMADGNQHAIVLDPESAKKAPSQRIDRRKTGPFCGRKKFHVSNMIASPPPAWAYQSA